MSKSYRRFPLVVALVAPTLFAPALAQQPSFEGWLAALRKEALVAGISETTVNAALANLQPLPRVLELDRRQPESVLTLDEYLKRIVTPARIRTGRALLAQNRTLLNKLAAKHGVQPRYLVALWGMESDFGRLRGRFSIVASLATLAYDGRRSDYFRQELLEALRILDEGHITLAAMTGSWAGAMGQVQFMPSTFRRYAADYDGDGHRDIWHDYGDALASAANYLSQSGWQRGETWGRPVRLPPHGIDPAVIGRDKPRPLTAWVAAGVRRHDGRPLPGRSLDAALVQPDGPSGTPYLVYNNFHVMRIWNRSDNFAVAVGTLADALVRD